MQRAFILRLAAECEEGKPLSGRVDHVRSGEVFHFETLDQLVPFLTRCLAQERRRGEEERQAAADPA